MELKELISRNMAINTGNDPEIVKRIDKILGISSRDFHYLKRYGSEYCLRLDTSACCCNKQWYEEHNFIVITTEEFFNLITQAYELY